MVSSGMLVLLHSVLLLLVTANVFPSSSVLVTLMMDAIRSSETFILVGATWRNIPEDALLHSRCCEHVKFYAVFRSIFILQLVRRNDATIN
jgi:hypothetical protein